jgi:signal transduction histidine kinase
MENCRKGQQEHINEGAEAKWIQLLTILDNINDVISLYNCKGEVIFANKKTLSLLNEQKLYDPNNALVSYKFYDELGVELSFENLPFANALKGKYIDSKIIVAKYNEIEIYYSTSAVPIFDNNGTLEYVVSINRNITEDYLLKKKIMQKNKELEAIIENMPDAFALFDKEGSLLLLNAEARKMYPNLASKKIVTNVHDDYEYFDLNNNPIPIENLPTRRALKGERIRNERIVIIGQDKHQITEINTTPVLDDENNFLSVVVTHRDITEQIENQQKLLNVEIAKREALEGAMQLKDEFLYLITHEFRTPMTIVNSSLQVIELMYNAQVSPNVRKHLITIKQNTNRQLRLVNNLLDITKMRTGSIKFNKNVFDIVYVTNAIVKSVEFYARQKGVNLNFTSKISSEMIYSDEEKYERIMLNILSNALKYTPQNKNINVMLSVRKIKNQRKLYLTVKDEGIGIPKEKQSIIFERFGQVDSSLSRQAEGTGLGLYLVKLLLDALEGEITLESEEGSGSTFTIILPIDKPSVLSEIASCKDIKSQFLSTDSRIIQSANIEFSDIYF